MVLDVSDVILNNFPVRKENILCAYESDLAKRKRKINKSLFLR